MGGGSSRAGRGEPTPDRAPLIAFERLYQADGDPWGYATDLGERAKYRQTLAALGTRRFDRALEVGCSIGVFTELLAPSCAHLVAMEPSPTALGRARERLRPYAHVELVQAALPEGIPDGTYDLVVCSEVLYYLAPAPLLHTLRTIETRLAPGGSLIAVHFRRGRGLTRLRALVRRTQSRPNPRAPLSGERVHAILRAQTHLTLVHHEWHPSYLLDRFDRI